MAKRNELGTMETFMKYVKKTDTCWIWKGGRTGNHKYGYFHLFNGKTVRVHRHAYEQFVGEIPAGMIIHHTCRNNLCVNPSHLELTTGALHEDSASSGALYTAYLKRIGKKQPNQYTKGLWRNGEFTMPSIKIPKESLEGPKRIPPGIYSVRMDGFEQAYSKNGDSINLLPILVVVNNPDYHNRRASKEWLNTHGGWAITDFCHCFGQGLQGPADDPEIPGEFDGMDNPDIKSWRYKGPLLGKVGQIELAENAVDGKGSFINVKRYLCAIPGCKVRHSDNLLR